MRSDSRSFSFLSFVFAIIVWCLVFNRKYLIVFSVCFFRSRFHGTAVGWLMVVVRELWWRRYGSKGIRLPSLCVGGRVFSQRAGRPSAVSYWTEL